MTAIPGAVLIDPLIDKVYKLIPLKRMRKYTNNFFISYNTIIYYFVRFKS